MPTSQMTVLITLVCRRSERSRRQRAMEQAVVALRCEKEKVLELLEMFVNDSNFISKRHDDFNDFKSHFINWSRQYLRKEKPNGNGKPKKGGGGNSQDRYANRRGTDAKDHTAEDYDSTF